MKNIKRRKYQFKGVTVAATALSVVAWMFIAYVAFVVNASPFQTLSAVRTAHQAQQYADIMANVMKLTSYDELDSKAYARTALDAKIAGATGWEGAITLGAETTISDDNKQRIATINVYKTGDTVSRYSLQVPLSSQAGGIKGSPEDGSAELDNKLIIKYGTYHHSPGEYAQVFSFPSPFPHACVAIAGSPDTYSNELNWSIIKRDRTSFYMYMDNGGNYSFSWVAIGY